ncbi:hypothetical protein [Mesorhizobium sp. A623]
MQIPDWLSKNWSLFLEQPVPFISLAIICFALGYLVSQILCRERISTLKERVDLYRQKLDGASPDEASKKIRELEYKLRRLTALDLDEDKFQKIVQCVKEAPGEVHIDTDMLSSFGDHLAEQLDEAFRLAGWKVYRAKSAYDGDLVREIVLRSATVGAGSAAADRVKMALRLGEIPFRVELWPDDADHWPTISFRA